MNGAHSFSTITKGCFTFSKIQSPSPDALLFSFSPYSQLVCAWSVCSEDSSGAHWANPILSVSGSWESSLLNPLDCWCPETLRSRNSLSRSASSDSISIQTWPRTWKCCCLRGCMNFSFKVWQRWSMQEGQPAVASCQFLKLLLPICGTKTAQYIR